LIEILIHNHHPETFAKVGLLSQTLDSAMKFFSWLACAILLSPGLSPIQAQNIFFLPGDSFFSVTLTREMIKQWASLTESEVEFSYSRFDGDFSTSGNLGYSKLKILDVDKAMREALSEAYWRYSALQRPVFSLDDVTKTGLRQINGVVALIYSRDFDGPLGLKFNQDWQIEGLRKYAGLFRTSGPVVKDWGLGPEYKPLKLAKPVPPLAHIGLGDVGNEAMVFPVLLNAAEIKIILVGFAEQDDSGNRQSCPNLQRIFDNVGGAEYISVDQEGFTLFYCDVNEGWKKSRFDLPIAKQESMIPKPDPTGYNR